ncbi:glycoside hydrolase family 2 TIM barrel-domain containing protein [Neobacillus vireti]|uniref:glycoside hydrolase family 2 TIM barrel-domain containing protein n=1 Tax=Neobacillus vireti TaxID=220686 RepID=UPI002FFDD64C
MHKQDFNKGWTFGKQISKLEAVFTGVKDKHQEVRLPHDAMILTERTEDSPLGPGGGYFQGGTYQYVKKFVVPQEDQGKVMFLEFEGVYMNAFVYINGDLAGKYFYGYSNFYVQINDYVRYGKENELKVVVQNSSQPNARWYSGSGIYRNVKFMKAEPIYIVPDGVRITTVDADPDLAVLKIDMLLKNENMGLHTGYASTIIKDSDGNTVSEQSTKFTIKTGEQISVRQRITLPNPQLWDTENPNLYTCETVIQINNKVMDKDVTTFGIRKLQLDSLNGLRINGKTVKLKGGCIHHDNGVIGAATFEDAEERRIRKLKEAGYNAIRSAHNPISRALLDACDRNGMLIMDELADCWTHAKQAFDYAAIFTSTWEKDVEHMIGKNYNHPSVIIYSIGNELVENGTPHGNSLGRKIVEKIRSIDDTRFITNAVNLLMPALDQLEDIAASLGFENMEALASGEVNEVMNAVGPMMAKLMESSAIQELVEEAFGLLDIDGYNYSPEKYVAEHKKFPHKTFVGTETNPPQLDNNWEIVMNNSYVLGDFAWTAWDYLGEVGIGRYGYDEEPRESIYAPFPYITAQTGDFDITGYRLPISYWREIVWGGRNHIPYISVQKPERYGQKVTFSQWSWTDTISSWTFPGYEGKGIVVEVFSSAEEVELFVNGKSQGKKPVGDEFKKFYCKWDTVYEEGTVEAVAYIKGNEVGRFCLKTAGAPQLKVTMERECLRAGTNDLCYVNIELMDEEGNLNTAEDRKVTVSIEGPATILGSGTGRSKTEENYFDLTHETYYGRMLAVVRAGEEKGVAWLTVSSDGIETVTVNIPVV